MLRVTPSFGFLTNDQCRWQQTQTPLQCALRTHQLLKAVTVRTGLTQQGRPPTVIRIRIRSGIAIEIRKVIVATIDAVGGGYGSCLGFPADFMNPTRIFLISVIFRSICSKKPLLMYRSWRLSR